MKIPNVDGKYATRDGHVKVRVTRSEIEIDVSASKSEVTYIDDDDYERPKHGRRNTESPLRKIGKGFTELSYALIGEK